MIDRKVSGYNSKLFLSMSVADDESSHNTSASISSFMEIFHVRGIDY